MLQSLPAVAKTVPLLLKSNVLIVLSSSRVENSFLRDGICQYYMDPSESAVTKVLKVEFTIGLHLSVVTGFWFIQLYFWTILSILYWQYARLHHKWVYLHYDNLSRQVHSSYHIAQLILHHQVSSKPIAQVNISHVNYAP